MKVNVETDRGLEEMEVIKILYYPFYPDRLLKIICLSKDNRKWNEFIPQDAESFKPLKD